MLKTKLSPTIEDALGPHLGFNSEASFKDEDANLLISLRIYSSNITLKIEGLIRN